VVKVKECEFLWYLTLFFDLESYCYFQFRAGEQEKEGSGGSEEQSETENNLGQTRHHRRHIKLAHFEVETVIRASVCRAGWFALTGQCRLNVIWNDKYRFTLSEFRLPTVLEYSVTCLKFVFCDIWYRAQISK